MLMVVTARMQTLRTRVKPMVVTVIPEWLIEELGKQGFRFDASGRPDMTSVSAGPVDNAI
jgi:hypothetical protein